MPNTYLKFENLSSYQQSYKLSNHIWDVVLKWNNIAKFTIGTQFIRATDSISANLAEGFGRFHKKDKQKFYYNARASVYESLDWLQKAHDRKLLDETEYNDLYTTLSKLPKEINTLIKFTEYKLKK